MFSESFSHSSESNFQKSFKSFKAKIQKTFLSKSKKTPNNCTMTNSKSEIPYLDSADIISCLTEELVSNPDVLAAYGRKLDTMVHHESGFIQYLPRCVKRRLKALKKLQLDVFKVTEWLFVRKI